MVIMTGQDLIKLLKLDGWYEVLPRTKGSHRSFKHHTKSGKVTVPDHKGKDLRIGTLKSIEHQRKLKLR